MAQTEIQIAFPAERMVSALVSDLLPTSYVPPKELRELRKLIRLRTYLLRERTKFKNKTHAELVKRVIKVLLTAGQKH